MIAPVIDATTWRDALPRQSRRFDQLLIVQCSLDWLRPGLETLREEIDDFVTACADSRPDLRVDRLVLHNLPTVQGVHDGDLGRLNAAHTEWMYRLASTSVILQHPALYVHRVIVGGERRSPVVEDFVDLHWNNAWLRPERTGPVLDLLAGGRGITPLTGYDVDLNGPFGDSDPSVYL